MTLMSVPTLIDERDGRTCTIAEASERTGVSAHTLRYYERVGLIDAVPRTSGGQRSYTPRDLGRIVFLSRMRATGMPVEALRRYVELIREGSHTSSDRRSLLEAHRAEVAERITILTDALTVLDNKIEEYHIWEQEQ